MQLYGTKDPQTGKLQPLMIGFEVRAVIDTEASAEAGHPKHTDVEYITKMVAGDQKNVAVRPVRDADRREFPEQYQHWKRGQTERARDGMALEVWPGATRAQVEDLRAQHIFSVEQFANAPDDTCRGLGHEFLSLRQMARDYLDAAKNGATLARLRSEHEDLRTQLEAARAQLEEARAELRTLKAAQPERRGPGRPPNSARVE
jgi:hypothetical protein